MKTFLTVLMTVVLGTGLTAEAGAAAAKRKRPHAVAYERPAGNPLAANGYTGYYERVLDRVPYGSQLWWRVYDSMPKGR
jgi:hypothetical protein